MTEKASSEQLYFSNCFKSNKEVEMHIIANMKVWFSRDSPIAVSVLEYSVGSFSIIIIK